jgi:lipopolysaccharide export system permease protein
MKLLDRYLLREYLVPLTCCLVAFCGISLCLDLFDNLSKLIDSDAPPRLILRYYAAYLGRTLEYLAPASLLLATLYTLWRLTRHNEITAMRASGVSMFRVMGPFVMVGLVFSLAMAVLRETVLPDAIVWARDFSKNGFKELTEKVETGCFYYNSYAHREWSIDRVDLKKPWRVIGVKVKQERANGTRSHEILASRGEYLDGRWWFYDAMVQRYDTNDNPVSDLGPVAPGESTVVEMRGLQERPVDLISEVREWAYLSAAEMLRYLALHKNISADEIARKSTDLHVRLAMPWICFIVTLFAVPAGTGSHRQNAVKAMLQVLLLFAALYALMYLGMALGKLMLVPPWVGGWMANAALFLVGSVLMVRMR